MDLITACTHRVGYFVPCINRSASNKHCRCHQLHPLFTQKVFGVCSLQTSVTSCASACALINSSNGVSEPCTSSLCTDTFGSAAPAEDHRRQLGSAVADNFELAPAASLDHVILNSFSAAKSFSEVTPDNSIGQVECNIARSVTSGDEQYSVSSSALTSCVQSLRSPVTCSTATLVSSLSSATVHPSHTNKLPFAVNWDGCWHTRQSPVSSLHALVKSSHATTVAEPFSSQSSSKVPTVGHSSHSENSRHRSVKAGSTWFPSELQTSVVDHGGMSERKSVERSSSTRQSSGGTVSFISPLKKFVDRHPTRSSVPALTLSHLSNGVGFSRNGTAVAASGDQPIDLSTRRRTSVPKLEPSPQPKRAQFNTTASDQPLDLSQSSSSACPDRQRTPKHSGNHSADTSDASESRLPPSGMIDLQNYCSRLLSGGFPMDSGNLLSAITASSSLSLSSSVSVEFFICGCLTGCGSDWVRS